MSKITMILGGLVMSTVTVLLVVAWSPMNTTDVPKSTAPTSAIDPFDALHLSAKQRDDITMRVEDTPLSPYTTYTSDSLRYTIRFPSSWELDDSHIAFDGDVITDPAKNLVIMMSTTDEPEIQTKQGQEEILHSIEESVQNDMKYITSELKRFSWKNHDAIFVDRLRRLGDVTWRVREYTVLRPEHGGLLNISISVQLKTEELFTNEIDALIDELRVCTSPDSL